MEPPDRKCLSPEEAANVLGVTPRYLAHLRNTKSGPPFTRLGWRTIRYELDALMEWMRLNQEGRREGAHG